MQLPELHFAVLVQQPKPAGGWANSIIAQTSDKHIARMTAVLAFRSLPQGSTASIYHGALSIPAGAWDRVTSSDLLDLPQAATAAALIEDRNILAGNLTALISAQAVLPHAQRLKCEAVAHHEVLLANEAALDRSDLDSRLAISREIAAAAADVLTCQLFENEALATSMRAVGIATENVLNTAQRLLMGAGAVIRQSAEGMHYATWAALATGSGKVKLLPLATLTDGTQRALTCRGLQCELPEPHRQLSAAALRHGLLTIDKVPEVSAIVENALVLLTA